MLDELWQHRNDEANAQNIENEGDENEKDGWTAD
jgi:hypothetical protein